MSSVDVTEREQEQIDEMHRRQDHEVGVTPSAKASTATQLIEIAQERYTFGVSTTGETYALPVDGPQIVVPLKGAKASLRAHLAAEYFRANERAAPQQALADALLVLEGIAQEATPRELFLRVASHDGVWWLDLGDKTGRAVAITGDGWELREPPVLFKRTALNGALPEPLRGGDISDLWRFLNVAEPDKPLVLGAMVSSLIHDIPHPAVSFSGEQGTGKTTAQRITVSIIDPGPVPTRKPPRDAESWVTAAAGSWVVGLDNLSDVPPWLSDSICRAVTGDGDVRRKLYTDGEHAVFAFRRVVILNGIDLGALNGDLSERMLPIHLDTIPESRRLGEADIWPAWQKAHPHVLGAFLDLAARVAKVLPSVRLETRPRMADFARIVAAVDEVMGTNGMQHYLAKQHGIAADSLSSDPFITALIERLPATFEGTAADLLGQVARDGERPVRGWPRNARAVTQRLHRHAPALRKSGWTVTDDEARNHSKVTLWTLIPPRTEISRIPSPPDPQTRGNRGDCGAAGIAGHKYGQSQEGNGLWEGKL